MRRDVDPGNMLVRWSCDGDAVCVAADFNGDGKPDLLHAAMDRSPVLFVNATQGGNWLALDLLGKRGQDQTSRSPSSAIGARVEFRSGNVTQQYVVGTPAGATAMPAAPRSGGDSAIIAAWTGSASSGPIRCFRPSWRWPATRSWRSRKPVAGPRSCPHLFAWNGRQFRVRVGLRRRGRAGLPDRSSPRSRDPTPPSTSSCPSWHRETATTSSRSSSRSRRSFTSMRPGSSPSIIPAGTHDPSPRDGGRLGRPAAVRDLLLQPGREAGPRRGRPRPGCDRGSLEKSDRIYASPAERDGRFAGYARDHFVELDFADRLGSLPPERGGFCFSTAGWSTARPPRTTPPARPG